MKRYVRSDSSFKVVAPTWTEFIEKIPQLTKYEVDSAYRRRRNGDNWLVLLDKDGNEYDAEYTKYSDGSYELLGYNINKAR